MKEYCIKEHSVKKYVVKKREWLISGQILLTLCALWGWWGMLYPEFTLTEDTYRIVYEEEAESAGDKQNEQGTSAAAVKDTKEQKNLTEGKNALDAERPATEMSARELYQKLLHAPKGQIRFKSKLLLQLQKWME